MKHQELNGRYAIYGAHRAQLDGEIIIQILSSLYTWYLHDHRTTIYHMTSDTLLKIREKVMQNFGLNIMETPIQIITLHSSEYVIEV